MGLYCLGSRLKNRIECVRLVMHILGLRNGGKDLTLFVLANDFITKIKTDKTNAEIDYSKKFVARRLDFTAHEVYNINFVLIDHNRSGAVETVNNERFIWPRRGVSVLPPSTYRIWFTRDIAGVNYFADSYNILNSIFDKEKDRESLGIIRSVLSILTIRSVSHNIGWMLYDINKNSTIFVEKKIIYDKPTYSDILSGNFSYISYEVLKNKKDINNLLDVVDNIRLFVQSDSEIFSSQAIYTEEQHFGLARFNLITEINPYASIIRSSHAICFVEAIYGFLLMTFYKTINDAIKKQLINVVDVIDQIKEIEVDWSRVESSSFEIDLISSIITLYNQYTREFLRFFVIHIYFSEELHSDAGQFLMILLTGDVERMYGYLTKIPKKELNNFILEVILSRMQKLLKYSGSNYYESLYAIFEVDRQIEYI